MKKIGLLGGSFNPPHQGHIHISNLAIKHLDLDEIWWIPTIQNPLKSPEIYENYQIRVEKCQKIIENFENIKIKNFSEIYTIDLIVKLKKLYPEHIFFWIMGADNFENFHLWKDFEKLIKLLPFAVFSRETFLNDIKSTEAFKIFQNSSDSKLLTFETENIDISSTQIRNV